MTDLLSQDIVDQFRAAMRDIADTFHHTPVILRRASGGDIPLMAKKQPVEAGAKGEVHGELDPRDDRSETVERWQLSFNREYLAGLGLVDPLGQLQITVDDQVFIDGKRFYISALADKAVFRERALQVVMTVVR